MDPDFDELCHQMYLYGNEKHGNNNNNAAKDVYITQEIISALDDDVPKNIYQPDDGDMTAYDAYILTMNSYFVGSDNMENKLQGVCVYSSHRVL